MKNKPQVKGVNLTKFSLPNTKVGKPSDSRSSYSLEKKSVSKSSSVVNQPKGYEF